MKTLIIETKDSYDVYYGDRLLSSFLRGWGGLSDSTLRLLATTYADGMAMGQDIGAGEVKRVVREFMSSAIE